MHIWACSRGHFTREWWGSFSLNTVLLRWINWSAIDYSVSKNAQQPKNCSDVRFGCVVTTPYDPLSGQLVWRANGPDTTRNCVKSPQLRATIWVCKKKEWREYETCVVWSKRILLNPTLLNTTRVNIACVSAESAMEDVYGWLCDINYVSRCRDAKSQRMETSIVLPSTWE